MKSQLKTLPAGSCDILLSDRGPSCFPTEQIVGKKVYFVRFLDPARRKAQKTGEHSEKHEDGGHETISKQPPLSFPASSVLPKAPSPLFPKTVSVADLLKARKLVDAPEVTSLSLVLENYNVCEKKWEIIKPMDFQKETKQFAAGGFRNAYMATTTGNSKKWVIKEAKEDRVSQITEELKLTVTQHTRKQVQLHAVTRSIYHNFIRKAPSCFGSCFHYSNVYFSTIDATPVTAEQFIPGMFEKYMNNTGQLSETPVDESGMVLREKVECLVHFSFESTDQQMMLVDIQGVGYHLCDPEIATRDLIEYGEVNFCAGNLSLYAIDTFCRQHICNNFCKMIGLQDLQSM
eukprot:gene2045-2324_t